jgi:SAM-dependent methyltransferase
MPLLISGSSLASRGNNIDIFYQKIFPTGIPGLVDTSLNIEAPVELAGECIDRNINGNISYFDNYKASFVMRNIQINKKDRILDLGTGTGVIALAVIIKEPDASALATDISPDWVALARKNIVKFNLSSKIKVIESDAFDYLPEDEKFDR